MKTARLLLAILLAVVMVTTLSACGKQEHSTAETTNQPSTGVEVHESPVKISAEEAAQMMEETADYLLIDVRTLEEYNGGHIPGALSIPVGELEDRAATELPDKDATLLVYCRSGNRSATAAALLDRLGYQAVYDFGGIMNWTGEVVKD